MEKTAYFQNLRQLNKIRMAVEEWRIQILEVEANGGDAEMKELWVAKKRIDKRLEELNYRRILDIVNKYEKENQLDLTL